MKITELKLRIITSIDNLIDKYYGDPTMLDKFVNATLKLLVQQNANKYDNVLNMFADENGNIDAHTVVSTYANMLEGEGITVDLRRYVPGYIGSMLPNKILILRKEDIMDILL